LLGPIDCSKIPAQAIHRLAESIPWSRFLGSLNVYKYGLRTTAEFHGVPHGVRWSNRTYIARALSSLLATSAVWCSDLTDVVTFGGFIKDEYCS
jgi:hypothetical protein